MNSVHSPRKPKFFVFSVAVLLLAAFFRLHEFASIPPGTHPDVGQYVSDGLRISRVGSFPLYLETYPEPLWRFVLGVAIWWTQAAPFTERLAGIFVGLLTVAVTLRATHELLRLDLTLSPAARHMGGLGAAITVTSIVALQFMNRQGYRASLLPLAVGVMVLMFARAWRTRTLGDFGLAGFAAGFPVNTYTSGLVIPVAALGVLVYMILLAPKSARPSRPCIARFLLGMFIAITPQLTLYLAVPGLYSRIASAQTYTFGTLPSTTIGPLFDSVPDLWRRFEATVSAFFHPDYSYAYPNYNAREIAHLNLFFAVLVLIGWLSAVRYSRRAAASLIFPLCTGVFLASLMPGMFSSNPDNPLRVSGGFLPLAMLAGLGVAQISEKVCLARSFGVVLRAVALAAIILGLAVGLFHSYTVFQRHWEAEDLWEEPEYWLSIPAYFSVGYFDLLHMLQEVEQPVYVPVSQVNTSLGAWYLWSEAFPRVTSPIYDPEDGFTDLPPGEIWLPRIAEYNVPLEEIPQQFVLLMPGEDGRNGTMTLIPPVPDQTASSLAKRVKREGTPILDEKYGWTLGWRLPLENDDLSAIISSSPVAGHWHGVGAIYDDRLELVGYEAPLTLVPGRETRFTLYWRVLKPIEYDIFSYGALLDSDNTVQARSNDFWMYRWIHPSPLWQVGEIIPDVRLFTLPEEAAPGAYSLLIGLYTPPGLSHTLSINDASGQPVPNDFLPITNHRIPWEPVTLPDGLQTLDAQFGSELRLAGYTVTPELEAAHPGDTVTVQTYWQAIARPTRDYTFFLHVETADGVIIAQNDLRPESGKYPTNVWDRGELVRVTFSVTLPENMEMDARPLIGVYSFPSLERLPITRDGEHLPDSRLELE